MRTLDGTVAERSLKLGRDYLRGAGEFALDCPRPDRIRE